MAILAKRGDTRSLGKRRSVTSQPVSWQMTW
jgi:hypothetical protein